MPDLLWLDRIQPAQRSRVGEKAFILSQLLQKGYPVLPGFAIATATWQQCLNLPGESKPILTDLSGSSLHLNVNDYRVLQQLARNICQDIETISLPPEWLDGFLQAARQLSTRALILRPSLAISRTVNYSLRGLLRGRACWCEPQYFESALKQVWSEPFRAKSLFYWQREGIELERIQVAVLVQPLEEAIASGKVSAHPTQWQIEATRGLGNALANGEVKPETYQIEPTTGAIATQTSAYQTRVYGIVPEVVSPTCLENRVLPEPEQEAGVLDASTRTHLIELTRRIQLETTADCSWEWVLYRGKDATQHLYLWQWNEEKAIPPHQPEASTDSLPLVTGVGASFGRAIAPVRILLSGDDANGEIPVGEILVAKTLEAYWLPLLEKAAGLILERGNLTSHGAILARELGIPALVGAIDATQLLETGESVVIDGIQGKVYLAKHQSPVTSHQSPVTSYQLPVTSYQLPVTSYQLPVTSYQLLGKGDRSALGTQLWVNLSQPSVFERASHLPVDGVGLVRSELMMLGLLQSQPLTWWLHHQEKFVAELTDRIDRLAAVFAPRPVFYRSTDWRSPECPPLSTSADIALNPSLGIRGTHTYRIDPALFEVELLALQRVREKWDNLHLILPFVRGVDEFLAARKQVESAGLLQWPSFQLWIMAEVPSVILLLSEYVKAGVRGIAIGTNDLAQLLLGADREHPQLESFYNESHPAVAIALEMLVRGARQAGISCSLCSQAIVRSPELVDRLIEWGITAISVEPETIESTYKAIAQAERRLLLEEKRLEP
ncbi:MAG: putative PEP-binding protein [Cyanobacteria bacterium P01_E01_bin.42]